jgi:hypothetical protein
MVSTVAEQTPPVEPLGPDPHSSPPSTQFLDFHAAYVLEPGLTEAALLMGKASHLSGDLPGAILLLFIRRALFTRTFDRSSSKKR